MEHLIAYQNGNKASKNLAQEKKLGLLQKDDKCTVNLIAINMLESLTPSERKRVIMIETPKKGGKGKGDKTGDGSGDGKD